MTDRGDVSKISDLAPSDIQDESSLLMSGRPHSRSHSASIQTPSTDGQEDGEQTWDLEESPNASQQPSISASLSISTSTNDQDAWLVEQSLPASSPLSATETRRRIFGATSHGDEDDSSDVEQSRDRSLVSSPTLKFPSKLLQQANERKDQSPVSHASSARRDVERKSSPGNSRTHLENAGQTPRPRSSRHESQPHATPKPSSSSNADKEDVVVRLLPLGKQSPGSRVASMEAGPSSAALMLPPGYQAARSRSVSSSSSSSVSLRGLPMSTSVSTTDGSFSFNDSFLRREGAKLSQAFLHQNQQTPRAAPDGAGRVNGEETLEASVPGDHSKGDTKQRLSPAQTSVRLSHSLSGEDPAGRVASPSSGDSEGEDKVQLKETHLSQSVSSQHQRSSVETSISFGQLEKAQYRFHDETKHSLDEISQLPTDAVVAERSTSALEISSKQELSEGSCGDETDEVEKSVAKPSMAGASDVQQGSTSVAAATEPEGAPQSVSDGEQQNSVSFSAALTASPSADRFRRLALAKASARRRIQAGESPGADPTKEEDEQSRTFSTTTVESPLHQRSGASSAAKGSDRGSVRSFVTARAASVSAGEANGENGQKEQSATPNRSGDRSRESVDSPTPSSLGPWSPSTHLLARGSASASDSQQSKAKSGQSNKPRLSASPTGRHLVAALDRFSSSPEVANPVDVQTRLGAVRLALDEYLCAHSVRLTTLAHRLDSTSSEASTLRELLSVELEGKSALLREVASLKWDLEVTRRQADRAEELREQERIQGEKRDEELRTLVEKMRQQVEKRTALAGGADGPNQEVISELRQQLEHEKRMREQERRDFEVRLVLASRTASASPSPPRDRASSSSPSPNAPHSVSESFERERVERLARQSVERDHEIRIFALQKEHDQALENLEDELNRVKEERAEALQRLEDVTAREEEVEELKGRLAQLEENERQDRLQDGNAAIKELESLQQRIEELEEQCEQLRQDARTAENQLTEEMVQKTTELNATLQEVEQRRDELLRQSEEDHLAMEDLADQVDQAQAIAADLQGKLEAAEEAYRKALEDVQSQQKATKEMELTIGNIDNEREEMLQILHDAEAAVQQQAAQIAELESAAASHREETETSKAEGDASRMHELESQVEDLKAEMQQAGTQRKALQSRAESLERELGDRGLTISKLQRANERLETEIQNHAIALAGKQQELSLVKRRIRRAGMQDLIPGTESRSMATGSAVFDRRQAHNNEQRDPMRESGDTQVLERGPVPAKAKGRRTMDVDHRMMAPLANSRRANFVEQSEPVRPSERDDLHSWHELYDDDEAEEKRSAASDFTQEDPEATPKIGRHAPLGQRSVSQHISASDVSDSRRRSMTSSRASRSQMEEPMSLSELIMENDDKENNGDSTAARRTSSSVRTVDGRSRKGRDRRESHSSSQSVSTNASSERGSTSSRRSGTSLLSETPGAEAFLARRQAANAAVQRLMSLGSAPTTRPLRESNSTIQTDMSFTRTQDLLPA